jgi:hypothetical protein
MANRMRNFQSPGFPHNFAKKKYPPELKYGLYRLVSTSATICDKNQGLKLFFEEHMVILIRAIIAGLLTKKATKF